MKKTLLVLAMTGLCFSAAARDISFGTEATYAPFEFYNESNELVGFDIDIANKICEELNATCKFTNQAYDSLIPSLKTRRIDAAIAGIDITDERSEQVSFTQSYYDNSAEFFALKDKFADVAALEGKRVGLQNGTTHQKYLMDKFPNIVVVSYDSYQNAILDLKSGRIDAIFSDTAVGDEWLEKETNLVVVGEKVTDPAYFGNGFGIAVRKGNDKLLDEFNTALDKMKADGTYQTIYDKWFE
ncbi:arginine ABC transporter substrate-binding protein [Zophobihabitans entericus]|uniref:Transporter substrate-binding domain-containing protein n=1 Tax=Zophobihabitans entericus TaxID=1635327 RepID=A0A6G9IE64_9GAMM|nr:arginine ABC transporter substrate-binding protein [Zophobihabitans entericus]QIQ22117.1 transporter substrate-binding domain-containing protein [Zophobihabitans entericus]